MALTVEDGTCIAAANAFVTRAALIAFATEYYPASIPADDTDTDAGIMRASAWLSIFPEWDGTMSCGRGLQGLAFPRTGVTDCNGDAIPSDEVPHEVENATFIASLAEIAEPGLLSPTITPGKQAKREKVDVIEVEYMTPKDQGAAGSKDPTETLRPVLTAVNDWIKCMATMPDGSTVPWPWVA